MEIFRVAAVGQVGRRAGGQAGRRAGGQVGRWAGGRAGRRAGGQGGRRAGRHCRSMLPQCPTSTTKLIYDWF